MIAREVLLSRNLPTYPNGPYQSRLESCVSVSDVWLMKFSSIAV